MSQRSAPRGRSHQSKQGGHQRPIGRKPVELAQLGSGHPAQSPMLHGTRFGRRLSQGRGVDTQDHAVRERNVGAHSTAHDDVDPELFHALAAHSIDVRLPGLDPPARQLPTTRDLGGERPLLDEQTSVTHHGRAHDDGRHRPAGCLVCRHKTHKLPGMATPRHLEPRTTVR